MEKHLITKQMLTKYDKNNDRLAISTLIFTFAFVITFCAFSKGFKVEMNIKTFGISLLVGAALCVFTWIILKILKKEPRYNYHLVEDVLLSKSTKVKIKSDYPFFSDNRTPGLKNVYVLNFLHSGVFQLPIEVGTMTFS